MSDTNTVIIEGRLTKNAEMRTAGQTSVVAFSIANNKSYKNKDGKYENRASFFDCEVWGKYGEAMFSHLIKGRMLTVTGELAQETWKDKNGQTNSRVKIKVSDMSVRFPTKNESEQTQDSASKPQSTTPTEENEEVPF